VAEKKGYTENLKKSKNLFFNILRHDQWRRKKGTLKI